MIGDMAEIVVVMGVTGVGKGTSGGCSPMRSTSRSSMPTTSTATPRRPRCTRASRSPTPNAHAVARPHQPRAARQRGNRRGAGVLGAHRRTTAQRLTAGLDQRALRAAHRRPRAHPRRIARRHGHFAGTDLLPHSSTRSRFPPTRSPSTSTATRDRGRASARSTRLGLNSAEETR